jgi:hypothetical protein
MYPALAALGGLGFPEMALVALVAFLVYGVAPAVLILVLWKFYQVLSRISNELTEIKQALRVGKPL